MGFKKIWTKLFWNKRKEEVYEKRWHIYATSEHARVLGDCLLRYEDENSSFKFLDVFFGSFIACCKKRDQIIEKYKKTHEIEYGSN